MKYFTMQAVFIIAALTILAAPTPIPREATQSAADTSYGIETEAKTQKKPTTTAAPAPASPEHNPSPAPTAEAKASKEEPKQNDIPVRITNGIEVNKDWRDKWAWVLNVLLVAVGISGIIAALCTLRAINRQVVLSERQTAATEIAANAAKLNAEALVNSERAWIVIEKTGFPGLAAPTDPLAHALLQAYAVFDFANRGRTVATIIDAKTRFHIVKTLGDLPDTPDYGRCGPSRDLPKHGRILSPNETFQIPIAFEDGLLDSGEIQRIRNKQSFWCLYGCITYLDFNKQRHENQFCFVYDIPTGLVRPGIDKQEFRIGGPGEYNKHT